ncbi:MAG: YqgE/AlgH family protein [Acidobacteriota bacterium]
MAEELVRRFLVSVPQLRDPNFHRSVIFLVEHNQDGALGLVINRPSTGSMRDLLVDNGVEYRGSAEVPIMLGGPVQPDQALLLHAEQDVDAESRQVGSGLRLSGSLRVLKQVFGRAAPRARVYFGYAGWGPGQLEAEIEAGAWILAPVDPSLIFDAPSDKVWDRALRDLGIDPSMLLAPGGSIN